MRLIVLRGIPGAGKSTFIKKELPRVDVIASADDGMMVDGKYMFDPAKLPAAHGACLRKVVAALQGGKAELIVVDNTSTSIAEIAPYVALGQAYGAEVVVMTLRIDPAIAGPRNVHGVPQEGVNRMAAALDRGSEEMPPWWDHSQLTWDPETQEYRTF